MKKLLSILGLATLTAVFITAACSNTSSTTKDQSSTSQVQKRTANAPKPKNWPWRGICIQSAKSDYTDIAYLASIHVNFVRIQIKSPKRAKREKINPVTAFYNELEWADKILDECKKYNMTSIIAFNHLVLDPAKEVDDKSAEFWSKREYTDSVFNMVDIIAKKFATRGDELSAYEIIGEPAVESFGKTSVPPSLDKFYATVLNRIRKYDQERYFLLSPGPWGKPNNYAKFEGFNIKDPKIIYGAHIYVPFPFTQQGIRERPKGVAYPGSIKGEKWDKELLQKNMKALERFATENNALVYIGEFQAARWSPGADQWVKDVAAILEKNEWSWSYFCYKSDQEFWDPYYVVANPKEDPTKWKLKYSGTETPNWIFMQTLYAKNPH